MAAAARHGRWRWRLAATGIGVVVVLAWGGCNVERDYELLSFFFDGVPKPVSEDTTSGPGGGALAAASGPVSMHSAYIDRRCSECHGGVARFGFSTQGFDDLDESVCLRCHEDELVRLPRVHGPVAAGACMVCHEAHVSGYPSLLSKPDPDLCLYCHDPHVEGELSMPAHAEAANGCLSCHYGHGGADQYFLRPVTDTPPPAAERQPTDDEG